MANFNFPFFEGEVRNDLNSGNPPTIQAGIGKALHNLSAIMSATKTSVDELTKNIKEFSNTTSELSKRANRLLFWYMLFTAAIAVATVLNIFLR